MQLPIGFRRKGKKMRTSIFIVSMCCLLSCGLLKNSTVSKDKAESLSAETFKKQEIQSEKRLSLFAQTFWSNDSSEITSIVEISPTSSIRIFTKRKMGKSEVGALLSGEKVNIDNRTTAISTKEKKVSVTQKNKERKPALFFVVGIVILGGVLLFVLFRYVRMLTKI